MAAFAQAGPAILVGCMERRRPTSCTYMYDRVYRLNGKWTTSLFAARLLLAFPKLFWTWTMPAPCREMWMLSGAWAGWLFRLSAWFFFCCGKRSPIESWLCRLCHWPTSNPMLWAWCLLWWQACQGSQCHWYQDSYQHHSSLWCGKWILHMQPVEVSEDFLCFESFKIKGYGMFSRGF